MSFYFPTLTTATAHKITNIRPPPTMHHAGKKAKQLEGTKSAELFLKNINIPFPAGVNNANIRDEAITIFATMQRVNPRLALLPLKEKLEPSAILSGSLLPTEFHLLKNYLRIPAFESKSTKVHVYLQTTKRFNEVRFNPFVYAYRHTIQLLKLLWHPSVLQPFSSI